MEAFYLKLAFLGSTFFLSLLTFLPQELNKSRFSHLFTTFGKNFAGGIFIGIAFLDLLPSCYSLLEPSTSGIIAVTSYFLMLYIEKVAFTDHFLVSHGKKHTDLGCHHENNHSDEEEDKLKHILSTRTRLYSHLSEGDGEKCRIICQDSLESPLLSSHSKHSWNFSSIFLALVLSLHSIIEGIALGIQGEEIDLVKLGIAICIHKIPEAVVVGITLNDTEKRLKIPLTVIYVSASPLGVLIGMFLSLELSTHIEGIFLSICIGTFLYVAASEIFVEEFAVPKRKYQKLLAALFGFSTIALISTLE